MIVTNSKGVCAEFAVVQSRFGHLEPSITVQHAKDSVARAEALHIAAELVFIGGHEWAVVAGYGYVSLELAESDDDSMRKAVFAAGVALGRWSFR